MATETSTSELAGRLDKLYEFEREPVSADQLQSARRYPGLFAGEHVAATEFVIGVLFVQWGATASDIIWGLLLGNALAVLSWAFVCAPIATQVRLTLYWYVRQIIGPSLTVVYNFVNAVLYCCLAAAMIGVSASAVIIGLTYINVEIAHPQLTDIYPNSVGWVIIVLAVGTVVVTLAVMGFEALSKFATVCSPWMFLVFIAGAVASLPKLGEIHDAADLWHVAETRIWNGQPYEEHIGPATAEAVAVLPPAWEEGRDYVVKPAPDGEAGLYRVLPKLGFWHIVFFAWFCNLAMHVGLSDMALFRYAKHWYYGFFSAFGMYLGHFLAWMCAGVMGAAFGEGLQPGPMADAAVGPAGLLAVLIAGWTTANPTIYRAGLALQIITPNWPRWKVTVAAGAITTLVALFPAIFMRLLSFVAIYGLMLMPIGAIVVVEHWLFPRIGWRRYWTQRRGLSTNVPALFAWVLVIGLSFPIEDFTGGRLVSPMEIIDLHLFFRWLPGWFIAAGTYLLLAPLFGAKRSEAELLGDGFLEAVASVDPLAPDAAAAEVASDAAARSSLSLAPGATTPSFAPGATTPPLAPGAPSPSLAPAAGTYRTESGVTSTDAPGSTTPRTGGGLHHLVGLHHVVGLLALASLICCLILPFWYVAGGSAGTYRGAYMAATVVYFVTAIVWYARREKESAP